MHRMLFLLLAPWHPSCTCHASNKCRPHCSVCERAFPGLGRRICCAEDCLAAFFEGSFGQPARQGGPKRCNPSRIPLSIDVKLLVFSRGIENRAVLKTWCKQDPRQILALGKQAGCDAGAQQDGPFLTSRPSKMMLYTIKSGTVQVW
jgi:hypothetical protein